MQSKAKKKPSIEQLESALDAIRSHLEVDGGNVQVVDITDDNVVKVKWIGNCMTCDLSAMTLKAGIEHTIKNQFPQVRAVEAIN